MLGVALIEECIKNNVEVLAICRPGTKRLKRLPKSSLIQVAYASIDDLLSIEKQQKDIDVFYHFAWDHTDKENRDNPILQSDNIRYTLDAVKLAGRLGCRCFIGAGSQAEYGAVKGIITEETECHPLIAYGMAKLSACMLAEKLCGQMGISFVWARIFSVYGINDNAGTMIDYALKCFEEGTPAKFSSATNIWNYLYESDAGRAFFLLGEREVESGIYCLGADKSMELREYIMKIADLHGCSDLCVFSKEKTTAQDLLVDIRKLKKATDFCEEVSFEEGIRRIMEVRK